MMIHLSIVAVFMQALSEAAQRRPRTIYVIGRNGYVRLLLLTGWHFPQQ